MPDATMATVVDLVGILRAAGWRASRTDTLHADLHALDVDDPQTDGLTRFYVAKTTHHPGAAA